MPDTALDAKVETLASTAKRLGLGVPKIQQGAANIPDQLIYTKRNPMSPIHGQTIALSVDFATPDQLEILHNNAVRKAVSMLPKFETVPAA